MVKIKSGLFALLFIFLISLSSCHQQEANVRQGLSGDLIIFHAGSLSVPFATIADSFMMHNPGVVVKSESAGSLASIRKITDLNRPCDILASADYILIDKLMIPEYASWNIQFAGNEMALVYHPRSLFSDRINSENWYSILLNPKVRFGRSDPNSDPCGYRTILSLKLAEDFYKQPGLTGKFLTKDEIYIRPKEVDLLALLESGTIDYIFIYKSVALQHKLPFVTLPDSINLRNPELEDVYKQVSVRIAGNKPGETIMQQGEPMVYGITIPGNCQNLPAAKAFISYLLTDGRQLLQKMGQMPVKPTVTGDMKRFPEELKSLF